MAVVDNQNGTYSVSYVLAECKDGSFPLVIRLRGQPICGSPFCVVARDLRWMETTDSFSGFRKIPHTRIAFAVSKSVVWDETKRYDVPAGYRWASTAEAIAALKHAPAKTYAYFNCGGWQGYTWAGRQERLGFVFCDSLKTGKCQHAGQYLREFPAGAPLSDARGRTFAGLVCVKE